MYFLEVLLNYLILIIFKLKEDPSEIFCFKICLSLFARFFPGDFFKKKYIDVLMNNTRKTKRIPLKSEKYVKISRKKSEN
jgi:hypothetical protein